VRSEAEPDPYLAVRRAVAGDEAAREEIARRAFRIALRTATAALGSRADASDIAGDVTAEVLRSLRRLRDPARFDAWVHRITARLVLRAFGRGAERTQADLPDDLAAAFDAEAGDAIALRESMRHALASLPPRQRLAMALRYVHDLTEPEVAAILGCRSGTAASLLSRARATLRSDPLLAEFDPSPTGEPS
jgi:RNA polymerase sigma-70 factor, ECF subfamily